MQQQKPQLAPVLPRPGHHMRAYPVRVPEGCSYVNLKFGVQTQILFYNQKKVVWFSSLGATFRNG